MYNLLKNYNLKVLIFFFLKIILKQFSINDSVSCPVYTGNIIKPSEASTAPNVKFNSKFSIRDNDETEDSLYSLLLTNPDGHLEEQGKEYVHWFM